MKTNRYMVKGWDLTDSKGATQTFIELYWEISPGGTPKRILLSCFVDHVDRIYQEQEEAAQRKALTKTLRGLRGQKRLDRAIAWVEEQLIFLRLSS